MVYFGLFRENSVCFGCFDTGPKHRNKPKQTRKKSFLVSRNKPKNNRNRLSFGLFRFEPKKIFDCFEDTLAKTEGITIPVYTMTVAGKILCVFMMVAGESAVNYQHHECSLEVFYGYSCCGEKICHLLSASCRCVVHSKRIHITECLI